MSPVVRKVLACRSLDGDTEGGRVVERLAPEVVMARLMSGTASSIRASINLIPSTICRISVSCAVRDFVRSLFFLDFSSALAAFSSRTPSDWISHRSFFVRVTADSRVVFPLADISSIRSIAGEIIRILLSRRSCRL